MRNTQRRNQEVIIITIIINSNINTKLGCSNTPTHIITNINIIITVIIVIIVIIKKTREAARHKTEQHNTTASAFSRKST